MKPTFAKKINRVLLINPKSSVSKGSIRRIPTPLGLLYMASVLEENRYEVYVLDSALEGYENVIEGEHSEIYGLNDQDLVHRIKEVNPDIVGVTCLFSKLEQETEHTSRLVKYALPDVPVVIGGIHPTWFAEKMMQETPEIDFCILKEGEYRLLALINALNSAADYSNFDGLCYRTENGILINPPKSIIAKLDELPFPARHLINMEKYIQIGLFGNPFPMKDRVDQILTSRGCPYACDFCATNPFWGAFRRRSADNIIKEIIVVKEQYGIEEIQFRDDNLTVDRKNALELFRKMADLGMRWCSGVMIRALDEEMIKAMAKSGCYKLTISPESGSERVLKELIHKPLDLRQVKPVVDLAHKYEISIHSNFVIGYPGETREEILRTFEFAKEIETDSAAFFLASPYPGSPLYSRCVEKGWLLDGSYKTDLKTPAIHIKPTDPEYNLSHQELVDLSEKATQIHNEWTRTRNTDGWKAKYEVFLRKHPEQASRIYGRVV